MDIITAIKHLDIESVKKLLNINRNRNRNTSFENSTDISPIHTAAEMGSVEILQLLILHGANVNLTDTNSTTPLQVACLHGHYDAVNFLLANGAEIRTKGNVFKTSLNFIGKQYEKIKNLLLRYGVEQDEFEKTVDSNTVSKTDDNLIDNTIESSNNANSLLNNNAANEVNLNSDTCNEMNQNSDTSNKINQNSELGHELNQNPDTDSNTVDVGNNNNEYFITANEIEYDEEELEVKRLEARMNDALKKNECLRRRRQNTRRKHSVNKLL